jgi:glycolate oxidase FAD binding subunit
VTATSQSASLEGRLREVLPGTAFLEAGGFGIEGRVAPTAAVAPSSLEEVAAVLRAANDASAAAVPFGGGTQQALGALPDRFDLALDLRRLNAVAEHEPADLTVTVQAGMTLGALQEHLAAQGQWLPLDPPIAREATLGGVFATDASGPARIAYGTARDLVIGMTVALADGSVVRSGGRVVKNVAGYDMTKMHIGALGTLGVILQVSMKVAPLPKQTTTMGAASEDEAPLLALAFRIRDAGLPANGLSLLRKAGGPESRLLMRFAGSPAAVERSLRDVTAYGTDLGLSVEQSSATAWTEVAALFTSGRAVLKATHLPSAAGKILRETERLNVDVLSYPTAGVTYALPLTLPAALYEAVTSFRDWLAARSGSLVLESAPVEAKVALGVWGSPRGDFELMRSLKAQMDPKRILNPGRFAGGL